VGDHRSHFMGPPRSCLIPRQPSGWHGPFLTMFKGLTMTPRFLREEAIRFRGMAADTDRNATRERFLAMAADYDARAEVASESEAPDTGVTITEPDVDIGANEPPRSEVPKIRLSRKATTGSNEPVTVQRRSVGRPVRE
jgi:hypothetical protein